MTKGVEGMAAIRRSNLLLIWLQMRHQRGAASRSSFTYRTSFPVSCPSLSSHSPTAVAPGRQRIASNSQAGSCLREPRGSLPLLMSSSSASPVIDVSLEISLANDTGRVRVPEANRRLRHAAFRSGGKSWVWTLLEHHPGGPRTSLQAVSGWWHSVRYRLRRIKCCTQVFL